MNMTRPRFFGKLMPKKPEDEIIVDRYHDVNLVYDRYPEHLESIVKLENEFAICSSGEKLPIEAV